MTAGELLLTVRARGGDLRADDSGLKYRRPAEALDEKIRQAVAAHRVELLALLSWDEAAVAGQQQAVAVALAAAREQPWLTDAQRRLLAAMHSVVETYAATRDPLLFGSAAWIEDHVARWREEHERLPSAPT